jgi:hypothetical protein
MRMLALLLVALVGVAHAQTDELSGPPSKTLERAIKLYDKKDFFSASIELQKVLAGETGDDEKNTQRAAFFAGKTAYQMGFYAAAWSRFASVADQPTNAYFGPTAKWVASLLRIAPGPSVRSTLFAYRGTDVLDDPSLASVRDELAYHLGRELGSRDVPKAEALAMLARVSPASELASRAELERARIELRAKNIDGGIALAMSAARAPALTIEATRMIASWTHIHGASDRALAPLAQLATAGPYPRYQHSRALLDGKPELPGVDRVTSETFDAVMLPSACRAHWPADIKPLARKVIGEAKPLVAKLLGVADNNELHDHLRKLRGGLAMPGGDVVIAALADPTMQDRIAWLDEIEKELGMLQQTDKAWQTTPAAADMLQELTLLQSVEAAEIGAHARQRLQLVARDLDALEAVLAKASPAVAFPAGPDVEPGEGLRITNELCIGGGTAPTQVAVRPQSGCGGCSTHEASPLFLVLGMLMFARIVRRARPRR